MNPLAITKTAAGFLVSVGAGAVVSNAIKASIPAKAKIIQKISLGVGGFVLSGMIGEMALKYTNENIDNTVKQFKAAKNTITELEDIS